MDRLLERSVLEGGGDLEITTFSVLLVILLHYGQSKDGVSGMSRTLTELAI